MCPFAFPPGTSADSCCSASWPAFSIVRRLDFGHSDVSGAGVSRCCFNLPFPDDGWRWASFHVLIFRLGILLGELAIQRVCQFLNWVVSLLLSFKDSFCVLDTSSSSSVCLTNICKMLACFIGKYVCFLLAPEGKFSWARSSRPTATFAFLFEDSTVLLPAPTVAEELCRHPDVPSWGTSAFSLVTLGSVLAFDVLLLRFSV